MVVGRAGLWLSRCWRTASPRALESVTRHRCTVTLPAHAPAGCVQTQQCARIGDHPAAPHPSGEAGRRTRRRGNVHRWPASGSVAQLFRRQPAAKVLGHRLVRTGAEPGVFPFQEAAQRCLSLSPAGEPPELCDHPAITRPAISLWPAPIPCLAALCGTARQPTRRRRQSQLLTAAVCPARRSSEEASCNPWDGPPRSRDQPSGLRAAAGSACGPRATRPAHPMPLRVW